MAGTDASSVMQLQPVYRITVFVPPAHVQALRDGIVAVDALRMGGYEHGMWTSATGEEQFRPLPGAAPAQGVVGKLECTPTVRLEFVIPRDPERLRRVLESGVFPHHPWEVPAVFVDEPLFPLP